MKAGGGCSSRLQPDGLPLKMTWCRRPETAEFQKGVHQILMRDRGKGQDLRKEAIIFHCGCRLRKAVKVEGVTRS